MERTVTGARMPRLRTDQPGIALLIVMLVTMAVAAIAAGAALIGANAFLINEYDSQSSLLESVADAGLELGRARLNANPGLYSPTSVSTLELRAAVYDADGAVLPGVQRTLYSMPMGGGIGEFGNFAALVAVAEDGEGGRAVRRLDLVQESFAVYAYFTNSEPSSIYFGNHDVLTGPVHSNSDIKISSTGATFRGPVTTAGAFVGSEYATFHDDTTSGAAPVLMPSSAQLTRLRDRASPASLAFIAAAGGTEGQSTLRLHFVTRDVDGDGVEEGFVRAYRSPDAAWVSGNIPSGGSLATTANCGHYEAANGPFSAVINDQSGHSTSAILTDPGYRRCFLGGADELNTSAASRPSGVFFPSTPAPFPAGSWLPFPGTVSAPITGSYGDEAYLFPIDRRFNAAFRGVIFVDGKVVVSGTVRGRLTLAATGNIIIGDDLRYATDPGAGTCEDILGLFSGQNVIVADNTLNAPRIPTGTGVSTSTYYTYDDTPDENIHASILALNQFTVQNPSSGANSGNSPEECNGVKWGRGCLNVTGGLIQNTRGIVAYGSGTGNVKSYSHDTCTFTAPPPYFPSTGHFFRGRYYEVDPTGFTIGAYFDALN